MKVSIAYPSPQTRSIGANQRSRLVDMCTKLESLSNRATKIRFCYRKQIDIISKKKCPFSTYMLLHIMDVSWRKCSRPFRIPQIL